MFTTNHIDTLRSQYAKIETIDPELPSYQKLVVFLDGLPKSALVQLSTAGIKFVSKMAMNRI